MHRHVRHSLALAGIATALVSGQASACDIALPRGLKPDATEKIPGWMAYRFAAEASASGHMLFSRLKQQGLPEKRAAGRLINARVRAATSALYNRRVTAQKMELLKDKTFTPGASGQGATGYAFVVIMAFGTDSVRAAGYLRHNAKAADLSLAFSVTHPDEVHEAMPVVERFAAHPGHECKAG
jgi:hypothetical protein